MCDETFGGLLFALRYCHSGHQHIYQVEVQMPQCVSVCVHARAMTSDMIWTCRKQRALPFFGPAFTAQLDMTYRGKIQSCSTILCTAEVESIEGRKVGMLHCCRTADCRDGAICQNDPAIMLECETHRQKSQDGLHCRSGCVQLFQMAQMAVCMQRHGLCLWRPSRSVLSMMAFGLCSRHGHLASETSWRTAATAS